MFINEQINRVRGDTMSPVMSPAEKRMVNQRQDQRRQAVASGRADIKQSVAKKFASSPLVVNFNKRVAELRGEIRDFERICKASAEEIATVDRYFQKIAGALNSLWAGVKFANVQANFIQAASMLKEEFGLIAHNAPDSKKEDAEVVRGDLSKKLNAFQNELKNYKPAGMQLR